MTKIGSFLLLASCAHGWIEHKSFLTSRRQILRPVTFLSADSDSDAATDTENPCWQDLYDDDCGMDSVYGASFVAKEWIKKLPCAKGVEDCDFPEELKVPGNRQEGGADSVDVMEFLHLKRADNLMGKKSDDEEKPAP